mmetsp:Transcript_3085/g.6937  ORF Transcript_3085/g.6937 Transcript_3085/m.6937 type:complete len:652 (+) Transcript_3085:95-2050(+)
MADREELFPDRALGYVVEWKGSYGYAVPSVPIDHPKFNKRRGKLYVDASDVMDDLTGVGALVSFNVYVNDDGLGAMNVTMADEAEIAILGGEDDVEKASAVKEEATAEKPKELHQPKWGAAPAPRQSVNAGAPPAAASAAKRPLPSASASSLAARRANYGKASAPTGPPKGYAQAEPSRIAPPSASRLLPIPSSHGEIQPPRARPQSGYGKKDAWQQPAPAAAKAMPPQRKPTGVWGIVAAAEEPVASRRQSNAVYEAAGGGWRPPYNAGQQRQAPLSAGKLLQPMPNYGKAGAQPFIERRPAPSSLAKVVAVHGGGGGARGKRQTEWTDESQQAAVPAAILEKVKEALDKCLWKATEAVMDQEDTWSQDTMVKRISKYFQKGVVGANLVQCVWVDAAKKYVEAAMGGFSAACGDRPWFFGFEAGPALAHALWELLPICAPPRPKWKQLEEFVVAEYAARLDRQMLDMAVWEKCSELWKDDQVRNKLYKALNQTYDSAVEEASSAGHQEEHEQVEHFMTTWIHNSMNRAWQMVPDPEETLQEAQAIVLFESLVMPFGEEHAFSCVPARIAQNVGRPPPQWPVISATVDALFHEWRNPPPTDGPPKKKRKGPKNAAAEDEIAGMIDASWHSWQDFQTNSDQMEAKAEITEDI